MGAVSIRATSEATASTAANANAFRHSAETYRDRTRYAYSGRSASGTGDT